MKFSQEEDFSFWKSLFLAVIFFTITPITLTASLFSLTSLSTSKGNENEITYPNSGARIYASLPNLIPSVDGQITQSDARPEIIKQYLNYYHSPLEPYSQFIIEMSDKYELDYRLVTAIAQQESNLCRVIPPESYNCWGWGIHSEGTLGFNSYEQGIETVSRGLREEYLAKGYKSVEDIMNKYTPLSNGSWAYGVNQFMNEMK